MCLSVSVRQQQALTRDDALETLTTRNRYLEERIHMLESHKEPPSRPSVGVGVDFYERLIACARRGFWHMHFHFSTNENRK